MDELKYKILLRRLKELEMDAGHDNKKNKSFKKALKELKKFEDDILNPV